MRKTSENVKEVCTEFSRHSLQVHKFRFFSTKLQLKNVEKAANVAAAWRRRDGVCDLRWCAETMRRKTIFKICFSEGHLFMHFLLCFFSLPHLVGHRNCGRSGRHHGQMLPGCRNQRRYHAWGSGQGLLLFITCPWSTGMIPISKRNRILLGTKILTHNSNGSLVIRRTGGLTQK